MTRDWTERLIPRPALHRTRNPRNPGYDRHTRPSEGEADQAELMGFTQLKSLTLAALIALPIAVSAQYQQGVQPYNPQDPQNYGAPASQSYAAQQPYQNQQQPYPAQQPYAGQAYDQPQYPQSGQQQIYDAPPPLPQYDQPVAPGEGYIWTPGYWAFGPGGYYWVPGAWVLPPYDDALWTPGYWGYAPTGYFWNAGYWGPEVGYYGGINYGFGYFGIGFYGGCWRDHRFFYNSYYSHIGGGIRNVYGERFNGIRDARPTGRSFTTASYSPRGNEFRGGSYNGAGRDFSQRNQPVARGFSSPGQQGFGRPATPGTSYSGLSHGYATPIQRAPQQSYSAPMQQRYSAPAYQQRQAPQSYSAPQMQHYSAPQAQQHYSAPAQQHYSAPSGGSAPHSSGGGGGFHGGGGRR